MENQTQPLFMCFLSSENHFGPDLWADATAGRRMFLDPDKHRWLADQMSHADKLLDITFSVESPLKWESQGYRLDLALEYIDSKREN